MFIMKNSDIFLHVDNHIKLINSLGIVKKYGVFSLCTCLMSVNHMLHLILEINIGLCSYFLLEKKTTSFFSNIFSRITKNQDRKNAEAH